MLKEWLNTEVIKRRAEEHGRELAVTNLFKIKITARCLKQLYLLTKFNALVFTNQLVIITGFADENAEKYEVADIYKALYITQYYKDILDSTNYDEICSWTPAEIKQKVPMLSKGAKGKLVVALNTYIEKGVLDSLKAIKTFEEVLGCDLARPE